MSEKETVNTHVQFDKQTKEWTVKKEGSDVVVDSAKTQKEAVDKARKLTHGEMCVHRKDNNEIRQKDTVGKKDPRKSRG